MSVTVLSTGGHLGRCFTGEECREVVDSASELSEESYPDEASSESNSIFA